MVDHLHADRPRAADYGMQVLSRVPAFASDRGLIKANHAARVSHLYGSNRADQIWTETDLEALAKHASLPVLRAVRLACLTGLRRGDLIGLRWGQVGDLVIEKATSKSSGALVAIIPLLPETKALLGEIGCGADDRHVLLSSRGQPWSAGGLTHLIVDATKAAGVEKTLHDARGTFATRLRLAGLERDQIADIMGWKKDRVDRILTRYVDQATVITAMVEKLRANEKRTKPPKRRPNTSVSGRNPPSN